MLIGSEAFYFTSLPGLLPSFNKEVTANEPSKFFGTQNHTFAD